MKKFYVLFALSLLTARVCAQDIPNYCLENDIVYHYMNDFTYDDYLDDYNESKIMYYFDLGKDAGYRLDAPKPVTLTWTKIAGATSQRIEVSESENYTDSYVYSVAADAESYDVYNLIPGRTYYYRVISVIDDSESIIDSGAFNTTGKIRMILAEGTWNVRDMGGWTSTLTGKPVAYGKIFRGAQLKAKGENRVILSDAGIEALRQVGIRAELDLRSRDNCPVDGSALAKDDGTGQDDVDFLLVPESVNARMYHFQNNDANIRELQWIINRLKQNKPVYFHCQNGADRTGTLGFLIGALLGVSEGDLAKDYEMTTFCQEAAVAYDPTEEGFARLRNYTGKMGSPLGGSEDNKEYMFAELANTMKTVSPANGTYQQKIYNFFRTGVNGTKISAADLSWFILEMTGYPMLGGLTTDVDTLRLAIGDTQKINVTIFPENAVYSKISFKSTSNGIATVTDDGTVTAVSGGEAYIIVDVDGIEKYVPVIVPITDESVVSISLANEYVERYLSEVDYSGDDSYAVSCIEKYDTITSSVRKDWATQVVLKWTSIGGITKQRLYVSEYPDFSSCFVDTELGDKDSLYRFENLLPDKTYYYKITATVSGVSKVQLLSSAFKTTGLVRMLRLRSGYNIRDLGGWTGLGGHKVKYGVLFRGCRLLNNKDDGGMVLLSSEDMSYLMTKLGVNAELDLRNDNETDNKKSVLYPRRGTYDRIKEASLCQGDNILSGDAYIKALKSVIEWTKAGKVVYMSGVLGIERTGTMSFLINGLLGVDEDGLSKDYELSSFSNERNEKTDNNILCKRSEGDFPAMVAKIKTLEGETLQQKIYNYFKEGINGTSISAESLDGFICYMLNIDEEELNDIKNDVKPIKRPASIQGSTFNVLGQEVPVSGQGMYIMDGKTVYVTE